jgi:hypothetical protein
LVKEGLVMLQQANPYSNIHVKLVGDELESWALKWAKLKTLN